MDSSVRESLENEVVYDRHVVTYKWLASKFDLHTNVAKGYLKEFMNEQEADGADIIGHSIVTGKQDMLYRIILTANQCVSETKKHLTALTGVHSFSAQPSNLEDSVNKLTEAATCRTEQSVCPIYCEAVQRVRDGSKRLNGASTATERKMAAPAKPSPQSSQEHKPRPSKPLCGSLLNKASHQQGKDKPSPTERKAASSKAKPKQNDLAAAFSKSRSGGSTTSAPKEPSAEDKKSVESSTMTAKVGTPCAKETAKRKSADKSPDNKRAATPEKKRAKTELPNSPDLLSVKRKKPPRRHVISDSEDEEDDASQTTATPANVQSTEKTSGESSRTESTGSKLSTSSSLDAAIQGSQKKRRRVMKMVKKTFKDEDGFLVTKLVKEMVSESDDEEEPLPKALREKVSTEKPGGKKRAAAAAAGDKKQQSLLSFFGKK